MDCCTPAPEWSTISLFLAFVTGLTISVGHCVGMCGPIQAAFSLQQREAGVRGISFLPALLRYHFGRVLSYTLIGAAFGVLGTATRFSILGDSVQAWFSLAAAAIVIVSGFALAGFPLAADRGINLAWSKPAAAGIRRMLGARGSFPQFGLGVANGFLPCGPVLAMAVGAAAVAHPARGALIMALYGLGTVPALIVLALLSHRLGAVTRRRFYLLGAALVVLIGVQLALRGLAALGVVGHLRFGEVVFW